MNVVEIVGEGFTKIRNDVFLPILSDAVVSYEVTQSRSQVGFEAVCIENDGTEYVPVLWCFGINAEAAFESGNDLHSAVSTLVLSWWN